MDLTIASVAAAELAAAFLQAAITVGLVGLCILLYQRYRKRYLAYWALAWLLYALRLAAIITFLATTDRHWLYWHQVTTGWTGLALLWGSLVFSQQLRWQQRYLALVLFPPVWSYIAIYQLDNFLLAAGPAVLFLSIATFSMGWTFFRYHRQVGSTAAALLAATLLLWGLHHLDYPFLRARGAWNPWGYYLDLLFVLTMGVGILLLVLEDVHRGLRALSTLSGDLQRRGPEPYVLSALLERLLTLPAVRGSAMYLFEQEQGRFVAGAGICANWAGKEPTGPARQAVLRLATTGHPEIARGGKSWQPSGNDSYAYAAALPVLRGSTVTGAMVVVGNARDPFTALDTGFLMALGQQVGAALENADLYRRLETRTGELERLAARMVQQHEEERRRLSRELHDETAQVFSAVKLKLGVLRESLAPELTPQLERALSLIDTGIQSIRNVTNDLRPSLLDDLGLLPALRALADDFGRHSHIATDLQVPHALPRMSDAAELALFRALQEGLANVARHAAARSVTATVTASDGRVVLRVRDDGKGLPRGIAPERDGHMGLTGMRERITALGGTVAVNGEPGRGVELMVSLPFAEGDQG